MRKNENFDVVLAKDCARAFTTSTGLGTVVSLAESRWRPMAHITVRTAAYASWRGNSIRCAYRATSTA